MPANLQDQIEHLDTCLGLAQIELAKLRATLRALHDEFAINFPTGENTAVDEARKLLGIEK
jgi:hypothetical protein